jgi:predicted 2-oxoglutarate/Fe(II)-dependent dioxygenase YbiX
MISHSKSSQEVMESVKTHNPQPTYLTSDKAVSQETADVLIELVNERGKRSEWSYNPDCTEFQIANPFSKLRSENDEKTVSILPELFGLAESFLRHMNWSFQNNVCDIATGHHGFWVLRYDEGGQFDKHCDWDSGPNGIRPPVVGTVCILLNDDFRGGETVLYDSRGDEAIIQRGEFSALMWDGFTQHRVSPVTEGTRYALVIHYTGTIK